MIKAEKTLVKKDKNDPGQKLKLSAEKKEGR